MTQKVKTIKKKKKALWHGIDALLLRHCVDRLGHICNILGGHSSHTNSAIFGQIDGELLSQSFRLSHKEVIVTEELKFVNSLTDETPYKPDQAEALYSRTSQSDL